VEKILISACLLGERVRYHGGDAQVDHPILRRWLDEGRLVPLCPEMAGGLSTPRPAAEISTRLGKRIVLTVSGLDVTDNFERGAVAAVEACSTGTIRIAILKDGSPSCGSQSVYDGSFGGRRIEGQGVTTSRLVAEGVHVFSESQLEDAAAYLALLEARGATS
jgi:uncharacterized protein YbbK (DUF523 family)